MLSESKTPNTLQNCIMTENNPVTLSRSGITSEPWRLPLCSRSESRRRQGRLTAEQGLNAIRSMRLLGAGNKSAGAVGGAQRGRGNFQRKGRKRPQEGKQTETCSGQRQPPQPLGRAGAPGPASWPELWPPPTRLRFWGSGSRTWFPHPLPAPAAHVDGVTAA